MTRKKKFSRKEKGARSRRRRPTSQPWKRALLVLEMLKEQEEKARRDWYRDVAARFAKRGGLVSFQNGIEGVGCNEHNLLSLSYRFHLSMVLPLYLIAFFLEEVGCETGS